MSASQALRGNLIVELNAGVADPTLTALYNNPARDWDDVYDAIDAVADSYAQDVKAVTLAGEDADDSDLTYAEVSAGAQVDTLTITGIQSLKAGSLWRLLWDNPNTLVGISYRPDAGGDGETFLILAKTGNRPPLGGEARRTKERFDFEATLEVEAVHLRD